MRLLLENEMRNINAGGSKYLTCPYCGYRKKMSLWHRLFGKDASTIRAWAQFHYSNQVWGKPLKH